MSTEVRVPTLGESVTEATVATWFKQPGDAVAVDEMLCELETDKVTVEVPSPVAGTLSEIVAAEGETVGVDALLAQIAEGDAAPAPAAKNEEPAKAEEAPAEEKPAAKAKDVEDAPSAKKLMAENNLSDVQGTGKDGRVMKEDVLKALSGASAAPAPAAAPRAPVAADQAEREERVKMTRLRQTIAKRLKDSQNTAAMLTTYNEVDMTEVMALRNEYKDLFLKKHGVKLGFMSFFTKACCHALKEVPEVNAEIDGTDITIEYYQFGGTLIFDYEPWLRPYLSLTFGLTRFDADSFGSEYKFSGSLGLGWRFPVGERLSLIVGGRAFVSHDQQPRRTG